VPKKKKPTAIPLPTPRSRRSIAICVGATVALLVADLAGKEWAEGALSAERPTEPEAAVCEPDEYDRVVYRRIMTEPVVIIDGYLELRYAENCGAAFGLMRGAPPLARKVVFGVAAVLASVALFMMFVRGRGGKLFAVSVPLIVSGALGNLVDRVRYGYVVDFVRFHLQDTWSYPTFNVADIGITVGVILLVLDGFRDAKRAKEAERAAQERPPAAAPAERAHPRETAEKPD
jgi:signal peptidase II